MSNVADSLRRRVLSHTESSMIFSKNELLSLCEAIDNEVRSKQERMREKALKRFTRKDGRDASVILTYGQVSHILRALEVEDG